MLSNYILISGGQCGVDLAVLDFAISNKLPYQGWIPKGRRTEAGVLPEKYLLAETTSSDYLQRTEWNVKDSDLVVILFIDVLDKGTEACKSFCRKYNRPFVEIDLSDPNRHQKLANFLQMNGKKLHIAGARERNSPGIYTASLEFLNSLQKKG